MADLKTDYKDDVLNAEVNELRKYQMIQNDDGTVSFEDVTEYLQVGDSFGSADVNAITERLTDGVLDTLEEIEANTQEGHLAGALSVKELKNTLQTAIDTNARDIANKLPLAGGTMTGKLNVQNVVPTTALTNACGSCAMPFHGMYAGKHVLIDSGGRDVGSIVNSVTGTTSKEGLARLQLGNSIANGTDGNSTGELLLFNAKGAYTNVVPSDTNAANIWHVLPSKAGYIPVVSVVGNILYIDT